jgi:hypothetical protein
LKIIHTEILIESGDFPKSDQWRVINSQIVEAVKAVDWPHGSGTFTLFDQPGKKRGEGSGVTPIKNMFLEKLRTHGWAFETRLDIATLKVPGPLDATCHVGEKIFCVEWETGNISSSHRALNKMCIGMQKGILIGGALILPTRIMYKYLTDRIGNYSEIEPYFPFWRSIKVEEGILVVYAIEHDAVSSAVSRIPKGTDGRSLQ